MPSVGAAGPCARVRKALEQQLAGGGGLWRHGSTPAEAVGFARCTGDGVLEATVWGCGRPSHLPGGGAGQGS